MFQCTKEKVLIQLQRPATIDSDPTMGNNDPAVSGLKFAILRELFTAGL